MTCQSACSTDSEAYLSFACDSSLFTAGVASNFPSQTASVQFVESDDVSGLWTATIDASGLTAGSYYKLCTDLDGATATKPMGENLFYYYITPVSALYHDVLEHVRSLGVQQGPDQFFTLGCPDTLCTNATSAYLATACDSTDFSGRRAAIGLVAGQSVNIYSVSMQPDVWTTVFGPPAIFAHPSSRNNLWTAIIDTSQLMVGQTFRVCVDLDGTDTQFAFGDSDTRIYVSAIASTPTKAMLRAPVQALTLVCKSDTACLPTTAVYLASPWVECDHPLVVRGS